MQNKLQSDLPNKTRTVQCIIIVNIIYIFVYCYYSLLVVATDTPHKTQFE